MALTIRQLKTEAYLQWEMMLFQEGVYNPCSMSETVTVVEAERFPYTNQVFRAEIRKFGDLRHKETWENAAIQLTALSMAHSFLEAYQIVGFMVSPNYMESPIRQHYGEQLIEAMLQFPEILDLIRQGLEQVYHEKECAQERRLVEQFIAAGKQLPGFHLLPMTA